MYIYCNYWRDSKKIKRARGSLRELEFNLSFLVNDEMI